MQPISPRQISKAEGQLRNSFSSLSDNSLPVNLIIFSTIDVLAGKKLKKKKSENNLKKYFYFIDKIVQWKLLYPHKLIDKKIEYTAYKLITNIYSIKSNWVGSELLKLR